MKHFIDRAILFSIFSLIISSQNLVAQCGQLNYTDFEIDHGVWVDGGIHAYRTSSKSFEGNSSMRLRSNSGIASSIYSSQINIAGKIKPELNFFYYPESMEEGEQLIIEASYDNGESFSILESYVSGINFQNNQWYNAIVDLRSLASSTAILRIRCQASATTDRIYIDNIAIQDCVENIIAGDDEGSQDEDFSCIPGPACDDQNPCTANDRIDLNCDCVGTFIDSDNDSVCDVFDVCPAGNDLIDLNQNGTPDACEERDSDCFSISQVDFEESDGIWVDGGSGAFLFTGRSSNGSKSFRLRGNGGSASSIYTSILNLSESRNPRIQFQYYPESMEAGEQLIVEVSLDSGISFLAIKSLTSGVDFSNYSWQSASLPLQGYGLSSSMIVRIRCAASSFLDKVYVDEIIIDDCPSGGPIASVDCLINTPCDDGNLCTENDLWTSSCDCIGTILDSDGDGVCDSDDVCQGSDDSVDSNFNGIPDGCEISGDCLTVDQNSFETGFGTWIDGGNNAEISVSSSFSGTQSVRLSGNRGSGSAITSTQFDLSSTIKPELTFQYFALDFMAGDKLDINVSYDYGESFLPLTTLSFGTNFQNGRWNTAVVELDIFGLSSGMSFQIASRALGTNQSIYIDDVKIQDCSADLVDVITSGCAFGTACDDGDVCTVNDVYVENCQCLGVLADQDTDGVCDANDVCPNGNDTVDLDANGIPDACDSQIGNCQTVSFNNFESDLGIWNLGGNNARLYSYRGFNSASSIRLTDNNGTSSSVYSNVIDLSASATPTLEFNYFGLSMEVGEELLIELSTDGGETFVVVDRMVSGIDFIGPQWTLFSRTLSAFNPSARSVIRLRCNASSTADKVFIDDLVILDCSGSEGRNFVVDTSENEVFDVSVFPNPTTEYVTISTDVTNITDRETIKIELVNLAGQLLSSKTMSHLTGKITLDLSDYESQQLYFVRTLKDGKLVHNEKVIKI